MPALALQPTSTAFPSTAGLASVDGRSEAAWLSSIFLVFFPVKLIYEIDF